MAAILSGCLKPEPVGNGGRDLYSQLVVKQVAVYDPDGLALDPPSDPNEPTEGSVLLDYVLGMKSEPLLAFDAAAWKGTSAYLKALDTPGMAYLMMALAGMEYYWVGDAKEERLTALLERVVRCGHRQEGQCTTPTGLELKKALVLSAFGFRADVVGLASPLAAPLDERGPSRQHFIVAIRGTQVKQESFQKTMFNLAADAFATATLVPFPYGRLPTDVDGLKWAAIGTGLGLALYEPEFSDARRTAHAGIYVSAMLIRKRLLAALVGKGGKAGLLPERSAASAPKPCIWLTGHSLGGGIAPLLAYRLLDDGALRARAEICGVYTFAPPRVANHELVARYNRRESVAVKERNLALGQVTLRYQLEEDLVPHVPPFFPARLERSGDKGHQRLVPDHPATRSAGEMAKIVAEMLFRLVGIYGDRLKPGEAQPDPAAQEEDAPLASFGLFHPAVVAQVEALMAKRGELEQELARIAETEAAAAAVKSGFETAAVATLAALGIGDSTYRAHARRPDPESGYPDDRDAWASRYWEYKWTPADVGPNIKRFTRDVLALFLLKRFAGLQHLGRTRFITRKDGEHFQVGGQPELGEHVRWLFSFAAHAQAASCTDLEGIQFQNSLTYHRAPFYAAVLRDMAGSAAANARPRFSYRPGIQPINDEEKLTANKSAHQSAGNLAPGLRVRSAIYARIAALQEQAARRQGLDRFNPQLDTYLCE